MENGSRYLRVGYTPSKSSPNIMNINFMLLCPHSDRINISRISAEIYNSVSIVYLPAVLSAAMYRTFACGVYDAKILTVKLLPVHSMNK
jgi:hypothetical protein